MRAWLAASNGLAGASCSCSAPVDSQYIGNASVCVVLSAGLKGSNASRPSLPSCMLAVAAVGSRIKPWVSEFPGFDCSIRICCRTGAKIELELPFAAEDGVGIFFVDRPEVGGDGCLSGLHAEGKVGH
eukprot:scaffold1672_cov234-Pinguiococcus_pyrenoidosus.AAC.2